MRKESVIKNPVIALAQVWPFNEEWENIFLKVFKDAAEKKADVICFPESTVCGMQLMLNNNFAQTVNFFGPLCKKNNMWAIVGTDIKEKGKHYNVAVLLDRNGEVAGIYRKQHLLGEEKSFGLTEGKEAGIFDTDFGRIGIVICYDIFSPKVLSGYEDKGVEILLCPSNMVIPFPEYEKQQREFVENAIPTAIAMQLNCVFGIATLYDEEAINNTKLVSPNGILGELKNEVGVVVTETDKEDLCILPQLEVEFNLFDPF